jgi:hypothetical protein
VTEGTDVTDSKRLPTCEEFAAIGARLPSVLLAAAGAGRCNQAVADEAIGAGIELVRACTLMLASANEVHGKLREQTEQLRQRVTALEGLALKLEVMRRTLVSPEGAQRAASGSTN